MREVNQYFYMPDSKNGGNIIFRSKPESIEVSLERGSSDWTGCTKAVKFEIDRSDAKEFAEGLLAFLSYRNNDEKEENQKD